VNDTKGLGLIGALVQANYNSYADATQRLIESLQRTVAELQTERDLMLEQVHELLEGPWMPTTSAIRLALIVHPAVIAERLRAKAED
jgi:hypothetical protein